MGNFNITERIVIPESPIGLSVAGSDCCAGAGLQADLKTFQALGVYGLTTATAVVAEVPGRVDAVDPVSIDTVKKQLQLLLTSYPVAAAKTGMFPSGEHIAVAATCLREWKQQAADARLVVDPVMGATAGTAFVSRDAIEVMKSDLFAMADLITPNLVEADRLAGNQSSPRMEDLAARLRDELETAVLLKGGHSTETLATDYLATPNGITVYETERLAGSSLHGTGCVLSAAITAYLARGFDLEDAVAHGKSFLTESMKQAHRWGNVEALSHRLDV